MAPRHPIRLLDWQNDVPTLTQLRNKLARTSPALVKSTRPTRSGAAPTSSPRVVETEAGWTLLNGIPIQKRFVPMAGHGSIDEARLEGPGWKSREVPGD